jgi:hypothetical protein
MEIHHIVPKSKEGEDTEENGIPLCLDCHAEVGSYNPQHPKGRRFTPSELRRHKDQWFAICAKPHWHETLNLSLFEGFEKTDADHVAGVNLSPEARKLLIEASQDLDGIVIYTRTFNGTDFQTNKKKLCQDQSARSVARWKSALDTLITYGLLEERDHEGMVFALTDRGFEVADLLSDNTISE